MRAQRSAAAATAQRCRAQAASQPRACRLSSSAWQARQGAARPNTSVPLAKLRGRVAVAPQRCISTLLPPVSSAARGSERRLRVHTSAAVAMAHSAHGQPQPRRQGAAGRTPAAPRRSTRRGAACECRIVREEKLSNASAAVFANSRFSAPLQTPRECLSAPFVKPVHRIRTVYLRCRGYPPTVVTERLAAPLTERPRHVDASSAPSGASRASAARTRRAALRA